MTALFFGFFASAWFGWAQERPPLGWRTWLGIGSGLGLALAAAGGILAWQHWSDPSALSEPGAMRSYGIIVGIEFATAGLGAVGLSLGGRAEMVAPWVCLVVGVHFVPLAGPLQSPMLYPLAVAMVAVAVAAVTFARHHALAPSAATGVGAGTLLLAGAAISFVLGVTL